MLRDVRTAHVAANFSESARGAAEVVRSRRVEGGAVGVNAIADGWEVEVGMHDFEVSQSNEVVLGGVERLRRGDDGGHASGCGRLAHETQCGPDGIVALIQVLEGHGAKSSCGNRRNNAVGVGILKRINSVDGQVFPVGRGEAGSIAGAPEEVAERVRSGSLEC